MARSQMRSTSACADGNVNITTEANKVWRAANGGMSLNQAVGLVEFARIMLCPQH